MATHQLTIKTNPAKSARQGLPLAPSARLPTVSPAPSELYPCVFFLLRARSNRCALLLNTSTINGIDKTYISRYHGS